MQNPFSTNQARDKSTVDLSPLGLKKPLKASELSLLFTKLETVGQSVFWEQRPDYNSQLKVIAGKLE